MAVYPLNFQQRGKVVRAEISHASDVFIVDSTNFSKWKQGRDFIYHGGHYSESPVDIPVPRGGVWYAIIEGAQRASVSVMSY